TIVKDVEVTKNWWKLWGGEPVKIDGEDVMKFPGVFIFMKQGQPNGPTLGAFIDHVAFASPDGYALLKKLTDAGVKTDKVNPQTMRAPNWKPGSDQRTWTYTYSPDGLRVEVETPDEGSVGKDMAIQSDMMHFYFDNLRELRDGYQWYKKYFGTKN